MNRVWAIIAASGLLASAGAAQGISGEGYHPHMWGGGYGMGYGFLGGGLMLLIWVAIIVASVVAVRWLSHSGAIGGRRDAALDILKERLARGEIDAEEYAQRRKALQE